ncbi:MAG: hypothetical protein NZO58_08345, partial [Gemmataceae bacterium]|nr:hypothetical protein [Gemmataceae bacterium]
GTLTLSTHFQAKLVSWEIAGLTMLLGAAFAGATTGNGAKQGLCVAIGGTLLYLGYQVTSPRFDLEACLFAVLSMFAVGIAGGWFGCQLFPPVVKRRRHRIVDL